MPAKNLEVPPALSEEQIDTLLGDIAILEGQLADRKKQLCRHVQHYGPVEGRGLWVDSRQSWYEVPWWHKLARCVIEADRPKQELQLLLAMCFEKIGARSFWGFVKEWKEKLGGMMADVFERLDVCDENGGKRKVYGKPSIAVRKSQVDTKKNLLVELGEQPLSEDPEAEADIWLDGTNLSLMGDDEEEVA